MDRVYSKIELLNTLERAGLPCSTMWLRKAEEAGILISPRLPHARGDRAYTQDQINEIVRAFSPGGKGKWKP